MFFQSILWPKFFSNIAQFLHTFITVVGTPHTYQKGKGKRKRRMAAKKNVHDIISINRI